jgi:purine-nucleoside phosphorylase
MSELRQRVEESTRAIQDRLGDRSPPVVAIILGTGQSQLAGLIQDPLEIPYPEIPHFAEPTVESHHGALLLGQLEGLPVVVMNGRFHFYEGYSPEEITFPVRVLRALGARTLIVSNACGGMNPTYQAGDLVILEDHINLMGINPLVGVNDPELGCRFPDMSAPYDPELIDAACRSAEAAGLRHHRGVYIAVSGPCLETRAEYRFLRGIGADVVGMSTVPEVIVAAQAGLRVAAIGIVTDVCIPETLQPTSIEEIIQVAAAAEPGLNHVVCSLVAQVRESAPAPAQAVPQPAASNPPLRLGVALSGSGTTLQNLIDRIAAGTLPVEIVAVVSSSPRAYGLVRASEAGIPSATFRRRDHGSTGEYSQAIFDFFDERGATHVALAGWLKLLAIPPRYRGKVVNIHPALLPEFGGKGMYGDHVHEAVLAAGVAESGCTVHLVDDEYDHGPIVLQKRVPVLPGDTVETLRDRVQAVEREAYPEVLARLATGELDPEDGDASVTTPPPVPPAPPGSTPSADA